MHNIVRLILILCLCSFSAAQTDESFQIKNINEDLSEGLQVTLPNGVTLEGTGATVNADLSIDCKTPCKINGVERAIGQRYIHNEDGTWSAESAQPNDNVLIMPNKCSGVWGMVCESVSYIETPKGIIGNGIIGLEIGTDGTYRFKQVQQLNSGNIRVIEAKNLITKNNVVVLSEAKEIKIQSAESILDEDFSFHNLGSSLLTYSADGLVYAHITSDKDNSTIMLKSTEIVLNRSYSFSLNNSPDGFTLSSFYPITFFGQTFKLKFSNGTSINFSNRDGPKCMVLGNGAEFTWNEEFQIINNGAEEILCIRSDEHNVCDNCSIIDFVENRSILKSLLEFRRYQNLFSPIIRPRTNSYFNFDFNGKISRVPNLKAYGSYNIYSGPFDVDEKSSYAYSFSKPYVIEKINGKEVISAEGSLIAGSLRMFAYNSKAQEKALMEFRAYASRKK